MATYEITSPDGQKFEVTAPDSATEAEVLSYAQGKFKSGLPDKVGDYAEKSKTASALTGAFDWGTMGFGDEALAAIMAAARPDLFEQFNPETGKTETLPFAERYKELRNAGRQSEKEAMEDNPISYMAGGAAGALTTGKFMPGMNAQSVKGAIASGAGYGGLFGAGASEADLGSENFIKDTLTGAALGGGVAGGVQAITKGVPAVISGTKTAIKGYKAPRPEAYEAATERLFDISKAGYKSVQDAGVSVAPSGVKKIKSALDSALSGEITNDILHSNVLSVKNQFEKALEQGSLQVGDIENYRKLFSRMARNGSQPENAYLAGKITRGIDDSFLGLNEAADFVGAKGKALGKETINALRKARADHAAASRYETISDIVSRSQGDSNFIKRELTKIVDRGAQGFKGRDLTLLKAAARSSSGENLLKILGKFGFDASRLGSGVGAIFGATGAGVIGGAPAAFAVPAVGTAARQAHKYLTRGKVDTLLKAIEGAAIEAPAAQRMLQGLGGVGLSGVGGAAALGGLSTPKNAEAMPSSPTDSAPEDRLPTIGDQSQLLQDEGLRFAAYKDTTGNTTVGHGFNMDSGIAQKVWERAGVMAPFKDVYEGKAAIDDAAAKRLFAESHNIAAEDAKNFLPNLHRLTPKRQAAVVNLAYNLGASRLSEFSGLKSALENGEYVKASRALLKSKYAKQVGDRAKRLAMDILRG